MSNLKQEIARAAHQTRLFEIRVELMKLHQLWEKQMAAGGPWASNTQQTRMKIEGLKIIYRKAKSDGEQMVKQTADEDSANPSRGQHGSD